MSFTPQSEFRRTSRTEPSEDEIVAAFRIHLRDAGWPGAVDLDAAGVRAAVAEVQRDALRRGLDPLEHLFQLKHERLVAIWAPTCATCGTRRPILVPSRGWGVLDNAAACPACLATHNAPAAVRT